MKHFVGLMERFAVSGGAGLALPFQDRLQRQNLTL
jgi:hypothetical protein